MPEAGLHGATAEVWHAWMSRAGAVSMAHRAADFAATITEAQVERQQPSAKGGPDPGRHPARRFA